MQNKLPRIISFKHAKNPRNGVSIYSTVLSRSRSTRITHLVTGAKRGRQVCYRCSCEHASFEPKAKCAHIQAVARRVQQR